MSEKLKELREKQQKLVHDARAKLDEIKAETPEARAKEIEVEYDKIMAEHDRLDGQAEREERLAKREATHKEREEKIDETRRPNGEERTVRGDGEVDPEKKKVAVTHRSAFESYMRYGADGLNSEERNVLSQHRANKFLGEETRAQGVATGGAGAYTVAEEFMNELVVLLKAYGPLNDPTIVRRLDTATGASMPWPTLDDTATKGRLLAENTAVTGTDVTFGTKNLDAFKFSSDLILVSSELLQDAAVNVEQVVRDALSERIGRILNQYFTVGTGSSEPQGIVPASALGVTLASTTAITADEILDLEHSVDPAYRTDPSCRFMFNDSTLKAIRKLKDGQNNYLWQAADFRAGAPPTILGYPFSINQDMATGSTASPSEQEKIIIFGAMNRFVVRFVRAFAVRRLAERYADYDQVGFVGFMRADSELLVSGAVKHAITTA